MNEQDFGKTDAMRIHELAIEFVVEAADRSAKRYANAANDIRRDALLQGRLGELDGDGGGRVDLFNDPESPHHYDLLDLQGGLTADLTGLVEIEAGIYQGLRLVVDSARVTLVEGLEFTDGTDTATLMVPSGSESGLKVMLNEEIGAGEGESVTITVDFDVDRNFVIQGDQGQGVIEGVLFTPVLLELGRESS